MAQNRPKNRRKPLGFSKTVVTRYLAPEPVSDRRPKAKPGAQPGRPSARLVGYAPELADGDLAPVVALRAPSHRPAQTQRMAGLVREWLAELKVMGRSEQTIKWYRQKMEWYLDHESGPGTLDGLTSAEVKRLLGTLIDRGLKPNTSTAFSRSCAPLPTDRRCYSRLASTGVGLQAARWLHGRAGDPVLALWSVPVPVRFCKRDHRHLLTPSSR